MRGGILPVLLAGVTPLLVLSIIGLGLGFGLVSWQPPVEWRMDLSSSLSVRLVSAIQAAPDGLYIAGYDGCPITSNLSTASSLNLSRMFLTRYDLSGQRLWNWESNSLGSCFINPEITGISAGTGGEYATVANYSSSGNSLIVQKFDSAGNLVWARPSGLGCCGEASISAGAKGVVVAGPGPSNSAEPPSFLQQYNFDGRIAWVAENQTGSSNHVYEGSDRAFVAGQDCQPQLGRNVLLRQYYLNGTISWTRWIGQPDSSCSYEVFGVSGDSNRVYVTGGIIYRNYVDAFITQYDSNGNQFWIEHFSAPDQSTIAGITMSADSTGAYLDVLTGEGRFLMKYDNSGNREWSFTFKEKFPSFLQTPGFFPANSVGSNGVYVLGLVGTSGPARTEIVEFAKSASLVLFGLNPPYSFVALAAPVIALVTWILWYRREKKRHPHPANADPLGYGRKKPS